MKSKNLDNNSVSQNQLILELEVKDSSRISDVQSKIINIESWTRKSSQSVNKTSKALSVLRDHASELTW